MRKRGILFLLSVTVAALVSFTGDNDKIKNLRKIYSRPPAQWPKPFVDEGVKWTELGILPPSPVENQKDSLKHIIELGKALFFDTRLSGSAKISCASCHQPELNWTDGKGRSAGHEGTINKRNSPTIQNSWFYKKLFWDGRARDLEDQAFAPINSESEMGGDMRELPGKLRRIKGYIALFDSAYGDPAINPDRIAKALAIFQRTIISRKNKFDEFLAGNKKLLSNEELRGLHVFRTKAGCMNCHNGPMFSDNQFHNNGFAGEDKGLYNVTHMDEDTGKMKTPSLRDVMKTGPWMHDGKIELMSNLIEIYQKGPATTDKLIKKLQLTEDDKKDLLAFLKAISSPPVEFKKPFIPE